MLQEPPDQEEHDRSSYYHGGYDATGTCTPILSCGAVFVFVLVLKDPVIALVHWHTLGAVFQRMRRFSVYPPMGDIYIVCQGNPGVKWPDG